MRSTLVRVAAIAALAAPSAAQPTVQSVSLAGLGNGASPNPFGLAAAPDGSIWVAIAGVPSFPPNPAFSNDVVARVVPSPGGVSILTTQVGLFPEEIAFTPGVGGPGNAMHAWVSVNGAGTIAKVGANPAAADFMTVVATLPFPSGPFGPFGLATSPSGSIVYAGDFNCGGTVHAIDAAGASFAPALSLAVPGCHGRLAFAGGTLVVPTTEYSPMFEASVFVRGVDPAAPAGGWAVCLGVGPPGTFPSGQDVATDAAGRAFVNPYDLGARTHVLDGPSGALQRSIQSGIGQYQQGIGISPDGALLAVTDFIQNAVLFVDAQSHQRLALVPILPQSGPNDVVFAGGEAWVTAQSSASLVRIGNLPSPVPSPYALALSASNATPVAGDGITITLSGGGPLVLLVAPSDAPGPMGGGLDFEIGPFFFLASGAGPSLVLPATIPADPTLACVSVYAQGVGLAAGVPAASNPITLIVQ